MNEVRILHSDQLGLITKFKSGAFTIKLHKRFRENDKDNGERTHMSNELHLILKSARSIAAVKSRGNKKVYINFIDGKFVIGAFNKECSVACYKNGSEILI